MPKRNVPTKFRIRFRGGPQDGKIIDYEAVKLPVNLYIPAPPPDVAETADGVRWKVAEYDLSEDEGEFDIQAFFDFAIVL